MNNGTIPSNSPVGGLRGGVPLRPATSVNTTAGVVFDTGPFNFTADYFRRQWWRRLPLTRASVWSAGEVAQHRRPDDGRGVADGLGVDVERRDDVPELVLQG